MNITINKDKLWENLNIVAKAVSSRTSLPILECILLKAEENKCRLIGNDLEIGIESSPFHAEVAESGSIALEAKVFLEIVRKMPAEFINIESAENCITYIRSGKTEIKILGYPGDEFPFLPDVEEEKDFVVRAVQFKEMIRQTIFSVAADEKKPVLTGELLEICDGVMHLVAVDGFRISYRRSGFVKEIETEYKNRIIIPAKSLNELYKVLPSEGNQPLSFRFTDKHILFQMDEYTFVSRLIEGEFIKYDQVFNEDFQTIINIDRIALLSGVERACLIARDVKKSPVRLSVEDDKLVVTSSTEMGASYDEIPADIDGESIKISYNPKYLLEALRVINEDTVTVKLSGPHSPCIIKNDKNDSYKYLILPLRVNN